MRRKKKKEKRQKKFCFNAGIYSRGFNQETLVREEKRNKTKEKRNSALMHEFIIDFNPVALEGQSTRAGYSPTKGNEDLVNFKNHYQCIHFVLG